MGNAAGVTQYDEQDEQEVAIVGSQRTVSGDGSSAPSTDGTTQAAQKAAVTGPTEAATEAATEAPTKEEEKKVKKSDDIDSEEFSDDEDIEPVDVLLQFIPYYGQGDPSNDNIVRATLNALSVEDIDSKDEFGNTLLLLACQYRCEDLVRMMLNKGKSSCTK